MADSEADREITVEELIDLEQQAEFFVVIGQDEAAIDLLMAHVRSSGGKSPLPYLKLLDIYHRRGERETYERLRERFNRRFNAYAPDWATGPSSGPSLEAYPAVMSQLQTLWPTPDQALPQIEALLFRRHSNEGTFALPAYAELLFLAAIARDLAEQAAPAGEVDLLLPLGGPEPAAAARRGAGAAAPGSPVDVELHLDLDLDGPPEPPSPGVIH